MLRDRKLIIALSPVIEAFADRCRQPAALRWLAYFVHPEVAGWRSPRLILRFKHDVSHNGPISAEDLSGAALFFEYIVGNVPTGVFTTADAVGINTVVAEAGERVAMASAALTALLKDSGFLALATLEAGMEATHDPRLFRESDVCWAYRQRTVGRLLPLAASFDETLGKMGKSTRFNLRYYRRRLEKIITCEYVADAAALLVDSDLDTLNQGSLNPVSSAEFRRRVESASNQGSYLSGLRDGSGKWLSLIGGWRSGSTTVLFWQANTKGYEKHSLGTVMRSYFLEHEIQLGATELLIYGGTPHTMRHSFVEDTILDLVVRKRGVRAKIVWSLLVVAARVARSHNHPNFFLETISSSGLTWYRPKRPSHGGAHQKTSQEF